MIDKTKRYYEKNKKKVSDRTKKQRLRDREYIAEKRRLYRIKNREILKEKQRIYALVNPEKVAISSKKWHTKNKDRLAIERKLKRTLNLEKVRLNSREYYRKNRHKLLEKSAAWRAKNPARQKIINASFLNRNRAKIYAKIAKRNARKINQVHPLSCAKKIKSFYDESIAMTRVKGVIQSVDHIIPIARNGWHHQDNLQVMPKRMNSSKSNKAFWISPSIEYKDWRDVPRALWPAELAPKYLSLLEANKGKSIRWDTAA